MQRYNFKFRETFRTSRTIRCADVRDDNIPPNSSKAATGFSTTCSFFMGSGTSLTMTSSTFFSTTFSIIFGSDFVVAATFSESPPFFDFLDLVFFSSFSGFSTYEYKKFLQLLFYFCY